MSLNWLSEFAQPSVDFRPIPFWSWNETMEPDEVRRQCGIIQKAGWGGAFLHARIGLRTAYLGEEWFAACEAAISECRQLGLRVWLYDEEGWPSGVSGGSVPAANAAYRQKVLFARPVGTPAPEASVALGPPQRGLQIYHWTAPLGSWRFHGTCYADLLSREAMGAFLEDAYARHPSLLISSQSPRPPPPRIWRTCGEGNERAINTLAWAHGSFRSPNHRPSYACVSFGNLGTTTVVVSK